MMYVNVPPAGIAVLPLPVYTPVSLLSGLGDRLSCTQMQLIWPLLEQYEPDVAENSDDSELAVRLPAFVTVSVNVHHWPGARFDAETDMVVTVPA